MVLKTLIINKDTIWAFFSLWQANFYNQHHSEDFNGRGEFERYSDVGKSMTFINSFL